MGSFENTASMCMKTFLAKSGQHFPCLSEIKTSTWETFSWRTMCSISPCFEWNQGTITGGKLMEKNRRHFPLLHEIRTPLQETFFGEKSAACPSVWDPIFKKNLNHWMDPSVWERKRPKSNTSNGPNFLMKNGKIECIEWTHVFFSKQKGSISPNLWPEINTLNGPNKTGPEWLTSNGPNYLCKNGKIKKHRMDPRFFTKRQHFPQFGPRNRKHQMDRFFL